MQHVFTVFYFENTAFVFQHSRNTHNITNEDSNSDSLSIANVHSIMIIMLLFIGSYLVRCGFCIKFRHKKKTRVLERFLLDLKIDFKIVNLLSSKSFKNQILSILTTLALLTGCFHV